ncbi:hypothetical protein [Paenibacillus sp. SI8]|uniref:hypothetical protein n=1 Tax=unclassified Paenibacillus TaxID=185978 RepID=UPI00346586E5
MERERRELPTDVERILIRESILLPFLITIVENNARNLDVPLKDLFTLAAKRLMSDISADLTEVRKSLRELKIKVWEDTKVQRQNDAIYYRYVCRGYEEQYAIMRSVAKAELSVKLGKYVRRFTEALENGKVR